MKNLQELFEDTIKDLYNAENQFVKAMPKLKDAAECEKLKMAIETHISETEGHIQRLEQIAQLGGFKPSGKVCKAAQGLVAEAVEHLEEGETGPTLDAAIISCAQKNEHYEICSYGTVMAWAKLLGESEMADLLELTLGEEKATDDLLSQRSIDINMKAMNPSSENSEAGPVIGSSSK